MNIILWSTLISLVTLAVLLFNRSFPRETKIPSSFLGGDRLEAPRRLALTRPPWLLWLLVLLATLGAAAAYWPPNREGRADVEARNAVLWVDETFSAKVSRTEAEVSPNDVAAEVAKLGLKVFGLSETPQGTEPFALVELSGARAVKSFLEERFARPASAFARPLAADRLAAMLARDARFANGKSFLVVVSDGQRATLRNLAPLKSAFARVKLIASREPATLQGAREEVVPGELLSAWGLPAPQPPQVFATLSDRDERIPRHARPLLVRERFRGKGGGFEVVTRGSDGKALFPLIIACGASLSGPQEFDGFADLRAFAQFFSVVFRFELCQEETGAAERLESEPWRFRQRALWVAPMTTDMAATLVSGRPWYPRGFVQGSDAIVYVAPSAGMENAVLVRAQPVGLDSGAAPLSLFLMPPPPEGALGLEPVFLAEDKTPLGYHSPKSAIYYLRTTLAMPNGELGRSARWAGFWLDVARTLPQGGGMLRTLEIPDSEDFRSKVSASGKDDAADFSLWLNPATLALDEAPVGAARAGLLVSPKSFEQILLSVPQEERALDVVSVSEFEDTWRDDGSGLAERERVQKERRFVPVAGAILGFFALVALWLLKGTLGMAGAVVLAVLSLWNPEQASAQSAPRIFSPRFVPVATIPFRISWCGPESSGRINSRYRELRELLAERGTIRLPKEILAGACKPGASEIWWTDSASHLDPVALQAHVSGGGVFLWEGAPGGPLPAPLEALQSPPIGLAWERPAKRGMLYRSFYLLHSFDGCTEDGTLLLRLRKKVNAQAPLGLVTGARFLSAGSDCFGANEDYRTRSFVNLMYMLLTTDYKEDHMHLPELLNRVRNLGLEP